MTSESDDPIRGKNINENSKAVNDRLNSLTSDYNELSERAQQLLTEKLILENEYSQLKKRVSRLEDDLSNIKRPPLVIGHVQDMIDDKAVVRSSNGTVFLVSINRRLNLKDVTPGARVALNQDSLSIVEILSDAWDPLVTSTEIIDTPDIGFDLIGGLDDQIDEIRQAIELPFENPKAFSKMGISPPKGVLLTGPPGTGKTMLAKAVANSTKATFLGLVGAELAQKYIGEGGRMVRELFDLAKQKAPSIIFIDELDSIGSKRLDTATSGDREVQRTLMQLLSEMDGFDNLENVKIIAATNRPELLDAALLRPGRFDRIINIPMPSLESRETIFKVHTKSMPLSKNVNLNNLAKISDGFSGAEIKSAVIEAGILVISENRKSVKNNDFIKSISKISDKKNNTMNSGSERLYA